MKTKRALAVLTLVAVALLQLPAFGAWDKTKPPASGALVSADIRANWQAIEDQLGVAPSTTGVLVLPKTPTFKPDGAATARRVAGRVITISTDVGNVGAGEDNLMSHALEAGTLGTDGAVLRVTAYFHTAANANNKACNFYFGATSVAVVPNAAHNGERWKIVVDVVRLGAASQAVYAWENTSAAQVVLPAETAAAETLSGAVTVKFTGTATADNDIIQDLMIIEVIG